MTYATCCWRLPVRLGLRFYSETRAGDQACPGRLSDYFPPQEEQGGWRSLLPA